MSTEKNSRARRRGDTVFGVFFIAIGIWIPLAAGTTLGPVLAGLVIGGLGLEALVSALRDRHSLLSRIGPLP